MSVGAEPVKRPRKTAKSSAAIESAVATYTTTAAQAQSVSRSEPYIDLHSGLRYLNEQAERVRKGNEQAATAAVRKQVARAKAQKLAEAEARNLERQRLAIRKSTQQMLKKLEANDARTSELAAQQQKNEDARKRLEREMKKRNNEDVSRVLEDRVRDDERLALELQRKEEEEASARAARARAAGETEKSAEGRPVRCEDIGFRIPRQSRKTPQPSSDDQELYTSAQVREYLKEALERQEALYQQTAFELREEARCFREATEQTEQLRRELEDLKPVSYTHLTLPTIYSV